jgi:hypothetical protein
MDDYYKQGDIVVMNTDKLGSCYIDEALTYLNPDREPGYSVLKSIKSTSNTRWENESYR